MLLFQNHLLSSISSLNQILSIALRIPTALNFTHMNKLAAFFYTAWLAREICCRFLVYRHGDLYFLLQNFDWQIVLFELDNLKVTISEGKKDIAECVHKTATRGCKS